MKLEEGMKIHAICYDLHLSDDAAKLFTYIHAKQGRSAEGAIRALRIMLGYDASSAPGEEYFKSVAFGVKRLDVLAVQATGQEMSLRGELENRLRFHTDPVFQRGCLDRYERDILPQLPHYGKREIEKAFTQKRAA